MSTTTHALNTNTGQQDQELPTTKKMFGNVVLAYDYKNTLPSLFTLAMELHSPLNAEIHVFLYV